MSMGRSKRAVLAGAAVLAASVAGGVFFYQSSDGLDLARKVSGLDLPNKSRVVHRETNWRVFEGGHTLLRIDVPETFSAKVLGDCKAFGLRDGPLSAAGITVPAVDGLVSRDARYCFATNHTGSGFDLSVLFDRTLIVYIVS
jgi:hypothetical protein